MENFTFVDFVVGKIAGEMSAKKRWTLSSQLAETIKADKVETFRKVEAITKAKDNLITHFDNKGLQAGSRGILRIEPAQSVAITVNGGW